VEMLLLAGVQVDLINLLDLQVLQGNDDDDEGLELAAVPTDRDVRPEVDGQEGDKFDGELFIVLFLCSFSSLDLIHPASPMHRATR